MNTSILVSQLLQELIPIKESYSWIVRLLEELHGKDEVMEHYLLKMQEPYDVRTHNSISKFFTQFIYIISHYVKQRQHFEILTPQQLAGISALIDYLATESTKFNDAFTIYKHSQNH